MDAIIIIIIVIFSIFCLYLFYLGGKPILFNPVNSYTGITSVSRGGGRYNFMMPIFLLTIILIFILFMIYIIPNKETGFVMF